MGHVPFLLVVRKDHLRVGKQEKILHLAPRSQPEPTHDIEPSSVNKDTTSSHTRRSDEFGSLVQSFSSRMGYWAFL